MDVDKIKESLQSINGVIDVHHIHAWMLTSSKNIFSAHVTVEDFAKPEVVLKKAHKILNEKYKFYFSTVQLEKECTDSGEARHIDIAKTLDRRLYYQQGRRGKKDNFSGK